jgi:hypothetical protein
MSKKLSFTVENIEEVKENPNSSFAHMKVDFFASGDNAHKLYVSEETLRKTAKTIYNVPVVWKYDSRNDDALSHEEDEYPCGVVREGSLIEEKMLPDGRTMLNVPVLIWKKYSGRLIEIFKRDGKKAVSVEVSVLDASDENGKQELLDYKFEAITILGRNVVPAIPMAEMTVLSFAEEQKEFDEAIEKEFSYDRYSSIDFTIPENVKDSMRLAVENFERFGKGGNSVSLSNAKFILKNEKITPDKVRMMHKKLSSYSKKSLDIDDDKIRFELWGGENAVSWIKSVHEEMEKIDNKRSAFFVYKNISDANPAIKGIEPAVTVSQANEIAKRADAIGSNDEKNGWAIAISNFKKTHEEEDGKWVKKEGKEEMSVEKEKIEEMAFPEKKEEVEKEEMAFPEKKEEVEKEEMAVEPPVEEKKEEMAVEPPVEKKKEEEAKVEMSLDSYLDLPFILRLLEEITEGEESFLEQDNFAIKCAMDEMKRDGEKSFESISKGMFAKMKMMSSKLAKMAEENKAYMSMKEEFESLKSFKKSVEESRFSFEVEATLKDVEAVMPKDEMDKAREESKSFSLETIDGWKNGVKAKAFTFSAGKPKDIKNEIPRWTFNIETKGKEEALWKIS